MKIYLLVPVLFLQLQSFASEQPPKTAPMTNTSAGGSQNKSPEKKKSTLNTNIYEQDSSLQTFSAVVKVVREVQGEFQIFFEGKPGFFSLKEVALQHKLAKSVELKKPVSVEVDMESRQILSVEFKD